jgi:hypothetical protein
MARIVPVTALIKTMNVLQVPSYCRRSGGAHHIEIQLQIYLGTNCVYAGDSRLYEGVRAKNR